MKLIIGNKNYSSWSMRPWLLMTELEIDFDERILYFDSFEQGSEFKREIVKVNPTGRVPTLITDHGAVWDTLAIVETLAELSPQKGIWPKNPTQRALARSVCAEMHSGFQSLRNLCPMNIEASLAEVGNTLLAEHASLASDVNAVDDLLRPIIQEFSSGGFLFGDYSAADAFYTPVASRFKTYGLPASNTLSTYFSLLLNTKSCLAWTKAALAEHRFVAFDEPYREKGV
jgi:glutathione S-transferase